MADVAVTVIVEILHQGLMRLCGHYSIGPPLNQQDPSLIGPSGGQALGCRQMSEVCLQAIASGGTESVKDQLARW